MATVWIACTTAAAQSPEVHEFLPRGTIDAIVWSPNGLTTDNLQNPVRQSTIEENFGNVVIPATMRPGAPACWSTGARPALSSA